MTTKLQTKAIISFMDKEERKSSITRFNKIYCKKDNRDTRYYMTNHYMLFSAGSGFFINVPEKYFDYDSYFTENVDSLFSNTVNNVEHSGVELLLIDVKEHINTKGGGKRSAKNLRNTPYKIGNQLFNPYYLLLAFKIMGVKKLYIHHDKKSDYALKPALITADNYKCSPFARCVIAPLKEVNK